MKERRALQRTDGRKHVLDAVRSDGRRRHDDAVGATMAEELEMYAVIYDINSLGVNVAGG